MSFIVFVFRQRYVVSLYGAAWDMESICSRMLPCSIRSSPFSVAGIRSSCPAYYWSVFVVQVAIHLLQVTIKTKGRGI